MEVVWRIAYRAAQLLESPWQILDAGAYGRYWMQELMADPKTGPWQVAF
jgi:hypothetical protein